MIFKNNQHENISQAVMEQLGLEEEEDPLEFTSIDMISEEIFGLKDEIQKKDDYINKLERLVDDLTSRMDHLERLFYKFSDKR